MRFFLILYLILLVDLSLSRILLKQTPDTNHADEYGEAYFAESCSRVEFIFAKAKHSRCDPLDHDHSLVDRHHFHLIIVELSCVDVGQCSRRSESNGKGDRHEINILLFCNDCSD